MTMTNAADNKNREEGLFKAAKELKLAMAPLIASMGAINQSTLAFRQASENLALQTKLAFMNANLVPKMLEINQFHRILPPLFDVSLMEELTKKAKELNTPAFRKFNKEWGWLINKKPIRLGDHLYGLYKKQGDRKFKETINRIFYYNKNLKIVLDDVKQKYSERAKIIETAFQFHVKRDYTCAITLLLPHVEGILWDIGMKRRLVKRGYNSKKKFKSHEEWKLHNLSKLLFPKDNFHKIIVNEIYCDGYRNIVLHGRNVYRKKQKEISRWRSTLLILTLWRLTDE